ncbi:MAG: 30S ribosomal protein S12 methylthiotransferase RimO [Myxococcota bacterium]
MSARDPKARVFFRSLGCPKNQVDSEVMLGALALGGYAIAERLEDADVAVLNTCSFIASAREESVEAILELATLREGGRLRALLVAGCLPQRYGTELERELPEVDAFVGTGRYQDIVTILDAALAGRRRGVYVEAGRTHLHGADEPRLLIGGRHRAYLKIAEGCDRVCAFCAIPGIRGRFQSGPLDSLFAEARALAAEGVRELNLVSQDTTSWGKDLPGRPRLATLVRALDEIEELRWIRLLYLYPAALDDALIEALASGRRLLPYVDVPLQHASDSVLRAMRRGVTVKRQRRLIETLRERIPGVVLRTTFIVGFPGETDDDFRRLCDFVGEQRFDRLGVFRYSDEEGTPAGSLEEKVPREVARERYDRLVGIQSEILAEKLRAEVGRVVSVLVDSAAGETAAGRLWSQAPEVDGTVWLQGQSSPGEFVQARITGVRGVDLEAKLVPGAGAAVG